MKYSYDSWWFFSKSEKRGMMWLLLAVLLVNILRYFFSSPAFSKKISFSSVQMDTSYTQDIRSLLSASEDDQLSRAQEIKSLHAPTDFFDPNTLDSVGWLNMGLKPGSIKTVMNYQRKGGRFRKADDLLKIYGLKPEIARQWIPYVRIMEANTWEKENHTPRSFSNPLIDINLSDSLEWLSLPMIGPTLSGRIIAFRDKLGGFYSIEQIREVYGMKDSVFNIIRPRLKFSKGPLRFVRINTASEDEMKQHPYIRFALARAVFRYREQHGRFSSVNDLMKIKTMTTAMLEKLGPYLKYD